MKNLNGIVGLIIAIVFATIFYAIGIALVIVVICYGIYFCFNKYYWKRKIEQSSSARLYNSFLEEISDVSLDEIENSGLRMSIREIINEFGEEIIKDKRFFSILNDKYSFKDYFHKQILKDFIDMGLFVRLSSISSNDDCISIMKSFFDAGKQKYPNHRDAVITVLVSLVSTVNYAFISECLKSFKNENEIIPAGPNHAKIVIWKNSFKLSNISIHDILITQKNKNIKIKFEITGELSPNKEANYQDDKSAYHICCLFYNREGIIIGKSVLASNYSYANLLQIVNIDLYGIDSDALYKIYFYVEKGCSYYQFDQLNSGPYKYENQSPYNVFLKNLQGHFLPLSHILKLETSYNSHIRNIEVIYHQLPQKGGELIFYMEVEYFGDKSLYWSQLLIFDKNNILKQKISLDNSYITVNMYHFYTCVFYEATRLEYDEIGKISISDYNS